MNAFLFSFATLDRAYLLIASIDRGRKWNDEDAYPDGKLYPKCVVTPDFGGNLMFNLEWYWVPRTTVKQNDTRTNNF